MSVERVQKQLSFLFFYTWDCPVHSGYLSTTGTASVNVVLHGLFSEASRPGRPLGQAKAPSAVLVRMTFKEQELLIRRRNQNP